MDEKKATIILIGGIEYVVLTVDGLERKPGEGLDGEIRHSEQTIALRKGMQSDYRNATLIHEILHSILIQSGHTRRMTEGILDAIAFGLLTVRIDDVPLLNL